MIRFRNKTIANILFVLLFTSGILLNDLNVAWALGTKIVGADKTSRPKVIMLILNRVSVNDITNPTYKNINRIRSMGSFGLMTINTSGGILDSNSYVSLGGGDRLTGDSHLGEAFNSNETCPDGTKAEYVYIRNTGINARYFEVLNVSIAATLNKNSKSHSFGLPGELGTALHKKNLKTAVIGNSDLGLSDPPNRLGASIAMDELGRVNFGDVSQYLLKKDPASPYGWKTDYQKMLISLNKVWDKSDFIVVETGDTLRANENSSEQTKRMKELNRHRAITAADEFIGQILPKINRNVLFVLVSPLPYNQLIREGVRVSPVLMAGGMIEKGGIINSLSTRQPGLISYNDISATILNFFGINKNDRVVGLPVRSITSLNNNLFINKLYNSLFYASQSRGGILFFFTRYNWLVMGLTLCLLIWNIKNKRLQTLARILLIGQLILPATILLTAAVEINYYLSFTLLLLSSAALTYAAFKIKNNLTLFQIITLFLVIPCIVDVLTGCNLMKKAALSYDLVAGGRFYGIGNEYMGVVIGTAILGISSWLQQFRLEKKKMVRAKTLFICSLIFLGLVLFFAAPFAGTNAGGALAAVAGFACALYLYSGRKVSFKSVAGISGTLIIGISILITVNMATPVSSHIGRSLNYLLMGDISAIWQIIQRKLVANIYLLKHSPFSILLISQFLVLGVLLFKKGFIKNIVKYQPYSAAGFLSTFIGALVAFAFNDSGVIAAALMLNYLVAPLLIQSRHVSGERLC